MSFRSKLREYWHQVYDLIAGEAGDDFVYNCKEISRRIDLGEKPRSFKDGLRFYLHISMCQACANYLAARKALSRAVQMLMKSLFSSGDISSLNAKLLTRFSKKT